MTLSMYRTAFYSHGVVFYSHSVVYQQLNLSRIEYSVYFVWEGGSD